MNETPALEARLSGRRREALVERVDHISDERPPRSVLAELPTAGSVENPAIGMSRHSLQCCPERGQEHHRAPSLPLDRPHVTESPTSDAGTFVCQSESSSLKIDVGPAE